VSERQRRPKIHEGASISTQYILIQQRSFQLYWRSPVYLRGKIVLNLVAGLFLGFTFYKEPNSAQGLQNKMFATFTSVVLSARKFQ
jgi:ABC-type multidrug transport system permease subunit